MSVDAFSSICGFITPVVVANVVIKNFIDVSVPLIYPMEMSYINIL